MNSPSFLFTIFFTLIFSVGELAAQCNDFFAWEKGQVVIFQMLDKKDKESGEQKITVTDVREVAEGTAFVIDMTYYPKKGKDGFSSNSTMICTDEGIKFDLSRMMSSMMSQSGQNVEFEIVGEPEMIPNSLSVGQTLPDVTYETIMKMGGEGLPDGIGNMKSDIKVTDRKVEGKETLVVPAGTFECYKLSYKHITTMNMMGMKNESTYNGTYWLSKGNGFVKSATYDKKGKYIGGMVLKDIQK